MPRPTITLPPIHDGTTANLTIECDPVLTRSLNRYREFYRDQYGADVTAEQLVPEMLRCFLDADAGFQRFGRCRRPKTKAKAKAPADTLSATSPPGGTS